LPVQTALWTVDSLVDVTEKKLGGFSQNSALVFVRQEIADSWNFIQSTFNQGRNVNLMGPPGTGKVEKQ